MRENIVVYEGGILLINGIVRERQSRRAADKALT